MRIKKSTPSFIVFSELERLPLNIVRKENILKYWVKLLETDICILKSLYNYMLDDIDVHYNWLTDVRNLIITDRYFCHFIQNLGLGYVWKNQYVENKSLFFTNCNQLLKDSFRCIRFLKGYRNVVCTGTYLTVFIFSII
jgi:hypothetical protein